MSKFKAEKELLSMQDKQQSEKYRTAMSEVDRKCFAKINAAKRDMFKEKPGQEGFQRLYNYLRSLVEDAAGEEEAEDAAGEEKAEDAAGVEVQKMPDSSLVTLSPSDLEAKVKTGCAMLRENLTKERKQMIECVGSKIRAMRDAAQFKNEKERQKLSKDLTRISIECEGSPKGECEKLGATCEKFHEELATHGKTFKDIMSKFKVENELLSMQDIQQSEKHRTAMSEIDRECLAKIYAAKRDMLKEKPGQEGFQRFYNYLRSLVEDAANEEEAEDVVGEEKAQDAADVEVQKMPDSALVTLSPSVGSKIRTMRDAAQLKNEKESSLSSALSKKREDDEFQKTRMVLNEFEAAVKTAVAMIIENLDKEQQDMIKRVVSEIGAMRDASQLKHEKERQKLSKDLTRISKECEGSPKGECEKFGATCEKFREELATHGKTFKGARRFSTSR